MRSLRNLGDHPAGTPLLSDDIVEFHAARLLLLLRRCGIANRIEGLTKLAKLDFFVRYPMFYERALRRSQGAAPLRNVEFAMVRHHYGPWDKRYYHVLAYLEGAQLLRITTGPRGVVAFALTDLGREKADLLSRSHAFTALVQQMARVKKTFGGMSGSRLKKLIYELFDDEVASRPLGETIAP